MKSIYLENIDHKINLIVDGVPFIMLAGEVRNSSASSVEYMKSIWPKVKSMHLNTVLFPVYWELIEPTEGDYDFSLLDQLIEQACSYNLKLVLLWFGTWKNALSSYVPEWVKTDLERFPRSINKDGSYNRSISCFSYNAQLCDSKAFAAFMEHLYKFDIKKTVIMIQVENEVGVLGSNRDYGTVAQKAYEETVPSTLSDYLIAHKDSIPASLKSCICFDQINQNWENAFPIKTEEIFMAFYTAKYVNEVAAAGKEKYNLPMFVNSWTIQTKDEPGGMYPCGGPVSDYLMIWRAAAPDIDIFSPDIYTENLSELCMQYTLLENNPLLIPEIRNDRLCPQYILFSIGGGHALCISPFDIDGLGKRSSLDGAVVQDILKNMSNIDSSIMIRDIYSLLDGMLPIINKYRCTPNMRGIIQQQTMTDYIVFPEYTVKITYKKPAVQMDFPAGGLVIRENSQEYIIVGFNFNVEFLPNEKGKNSTEYVYIEEGYFVNNSWKRLFRLNGDEMRINLNIPPKLLRIKVFSY